MKKILFLCLALLTASVVNAANNEMSVNLCKGSIAMKEVSVKDYEAVKKALNNYLEAGRKADSRILKSSVYKDAIIYSADEGKVDGGSINSLFEYLDNNPPATELEADITSVDVAGNIAYAKVESDKWHGARYTDMFLLVKENNEWKILTKVFHTHK